MTPEQRAQLDALVRQAEAARDRARAALQEIEDRNAQTRARLEARS